MKVLLVLPYNNFTHSPLALGFPLGLGYLGSSLEKDGHEVKIVDALSEKRNVFKEIVRFRPDVVGISTYTALIRSAINIAKAVKSFFPNIMVVAGGAHATYDSENLIENYPFDYIIRGEGERSFCELLNHSNGTKIRESQLEPNLDSIPYPAYHLVDFQKYIKPDLLPNAVSIMSSRGCSHSCSFCSQSYKNKWRTRSIPNIIGEIEYLLGNYKNIKSIQFYDDNFTLNKSRVYEICSAMKPTKLNWCCLARVDQVDLDMLKEMKRSGCVKVSFGVESGDESVLERTSKRISLERVRNALKWARRAKLEALCFMMLGNRGETQESIRKSVKFALSLKSTSTLWSIAQVYPGTELARDCPHDFSNYLYDEELLNPYPFTHPCVPVYDKDFDREFLKKTQKKVMKRFLIHHSIRNFGTYLKHFLSNPMNGIRYMKALFR